MMPDLNQIKAIVSQVKDPEIPVLTLEDLGVIRNISINEEGKPEIEITPTYSGCPAMDMMKMDIRLALLGAGFKEFAIKETLSPPWTTDWMSEAGKQKLKQYGIAPPLERRAQALFSHETPPCPRCGSHHTELLSEFASTACKSMYRCLDCLEPFDYFKCH